jgi:hypothetical protein
MKKTKTYIKRKDVWFQLACLESSEEYQLAKQYATKKGLKYVHRSGYLFVEADGVTPDILKQYGCANLEGLYSYILRLDDKVVASELISGLNTTQTQSLWELIPKESKRTQQNKVLHDLCFTHMAKLAKGE